MSNNDFPDPSIIIKKGQNPGPVLAIMAGVHGNEIAGIKALRTAIETIDIESGTVYFIFANPPAIARNVRGTQMNLNRAFRPDKALQAWEKKTYERARALELMEYLDLCDALLDLHTVYRDPATPFIICAPENIKLAKKFPVPIRSTGWNKIEPGGTDYYMNKRKKIAFCVECGNRESQEAYKLGLRAIKIFLALQGAINISRKINDTPWQKELNVSYIYKTRINFVLTEQFADFASLKKGQLIGYDDEKPIYAPFSGLIIFANDANKPNEEAFIMGRLAKVS